MKMPARLMQSLTEKQNTGSLKIPVKSIPPHLYYILKNSFAGRSLPELEKPVFDKITD